MHMMILRHYLQWISLALLAFSLSACATVQSVYEGAPSIFQSDNKTDVNPLLKTLRALDLANDREAARNAYIQDMIAVSDRICEEHMQQIRHDSLQWSMDTETDNGALEQQLKEAIRLRDSDHITPNMTILSIPETETPENTMANLLIETIEATRRLARIQIKSSMENAIRQYSLKQGLLDVQAYHRSCSVPYAAAVVARAGEMTAPERNASIEDLMQLRQKLMDEGLNTRVVQQKIDALILDH